MLLSYLKELIVFRERSIIIIDFLYLRMLSKATIRAIFRSKFNLFWLNYFHFNYFIWIFYLLLNLKFINDVCFPPSHHIFSMTSPQIILVILFWKILIFLLLFFMDYHGISLRIINFLYMLGAIKISVRVDSLTYLQILICSMMWGII
jgi:hypothetical protein